MIASLAPGYFLSADYLALIFYCGRVHWLQERKYIKQSYRNRTLIGDAGGVHTLVVPVEHPVWEIPYNKISIVQQNEWKKKHQKAIKTAYSNSPFYDWAEHDIIKLFSTPFRSLIELNEATFQLLCSWFGKKVEHVDNPFNEKIIFPEQLKSNMIVQSYQQVFVDKCGFQEGLSGVDLFLNCGREGNQWLQQRALQLVDAIG